MLYRRPVASRCPVAITSHAVLDADFTTFWPTCATNSALWKHQRAKCLFPPPAPTCTTPPTSLASEVRQRLGFDRVLVGDQLAPLAAAVVSEHRGVTLCLVAVQSSLVLVRPGTTFATTNRRSDSPRLSQSSPAPSFTMVCVGCCCHDGNRLRECWRIVPTHPRNSGAQTNLEPGQVHVTPHQRRRFIPMAETG